MLASEEYTTRWAAISTVSSWGHNSATPADTVYQAQLQCYAQLRHDANPLIQAEADYEHRLLVAEAVGRTLPKPARRQQRKRIERDRPMLTFDDVVVRFTNHLHQSGLMTYTVADLERFIDATVRVASSEYSEE